LVMNMDEGCRWGGCPKDSRGCHKFQTRAFYKSPW
jgi:hypothetical protein